MITGEGVLPPIFLKEVRHGMGHGGGDRGAGGADGDGMRAGGKSDQGHIQPDSHLQGAGNAGGGHGRKKQPKPPAVVGQK